ncbi:MAG: FliA/WhiG family RNA polymerase sigma factor [Candidatus Schekmanbacteria bacterium]|nr:MAG: FliA/WhiG family RNA polymerase sigma factor [Candidatus Schekmanbacteria bacterium]
MKKVILKRKSRRKTLNSELVDREELIIKYLPLTRSIAERIATRLPNNVEIDELVAAGIMGLMDAADKFDPSKQIKFKTYAEFRIRGAILDELRAMDWLPRSLRRKTSQLEEAKFTLEQKLGRKATDKEIAEHMNIDIEELYDMMNSVKGKSLLSLDEPIDGDSKSKTLLECLKNNDTDDPYSLTSLKELKEMIAKAIDQLPEKERLVISLYYYEELTMKEIGQIMNVTESRVSQIHTKATMSLKTKLKKISREKGPKSIFVENVADNTY